MRFEDDHNFLAQHGEVHQLSSPQGGSVLVSPTFQGRVMTSAVRADANSLGYLNRPFITAGKTGTQFDNFGGEDRFWLGPEAGQFGLFFRAGRPFDYAEWQVPASLQEGRWDVLEQTPASLLFGRDVVIPNYASQQFSIRIRRRISMLDAASVAQALGTALPSGTEWVAFESDNYVTNIGSAAWTPEQGLISIWTLGQFNPSPDTQVIIPFNAAASEPIVNDRYFGKVPDDRLTIIDQHNVLKFKCDGEWRSKIGLGRQRAGAVAGSYSVSAQLFTLVKFNRGPTDARYVNSLWEIQADPYAGDVINSYNDGPVAPGQPSQGGFYELETSSPALPLQPGQSMQHRHQTFHFVGAQAGLSALAQATLGCPLAGL